MLRRKNAKNDIMSVWQLETSTDWIKSIRASFPCKSRRLWKRSITSLWPLEAIIHCALKIKACSCRFYHINYTVLSQEVDSYDKLKFSITILISNSMGLLYRTSIISTQGHNVINSSIWRVDNILIRRFSFHCR